MKTKFNNLREKLTNLFGRSFFNDIFSIIMLLLIFLIFLILVFILIFRLLGTDSLVPLSYNSIYGVTSLVAWYKLYFIPISFFGIGVMNMFISWAFFEKERLISYLLLFSSLVMGVFLIISEYNLTVLMGS
jgi:hypothetical protein